MAAAAEAQDLRVGTRIFDVTDARLVLPHADVFVFADVAGEASLVDAVAGRIDEACRSAELVVVAMEAQRAQRAAVLRSLGGPPRTFRPASSWGGARGLVLIDVDEDDPALYY